MKALTLSPGWAMLVMVGQKTIEHRTWKTNYRGDILICSSAKKMEGCISGHALAVAELVDIEPFSKKHFDGSCMDWIPDPNGFAWIFDNIRLIRPVPVKGKLGLFNVDVDYQVIPDDLTDDEADRVIDQFIAPLIYRPARK